MEPRDYKERRYLSAIEAAKYLNISVSMLRKIVDEEIIEPQISASGQMRFDLRDLQRYEQSYMQKLDKNGIDIQRDNFLEINGTIQRVIVGDAARMSETADDSIHLVVTSPPYFDAKMYSREVVENDLGNIHNIDDWFDKISEVWREVYRVLSPGRKAFINIMNLPVRLERKGFRMLNLMGRTIEVCEKIGFIFRRDIVWKKTNSVRAHFGTYPYPGGILINNTHEFILEFEKPERRGTSKYGHLTREQKEQSKLEKEFWISVKKSDVWVMKPEGSGDRRSHVSPFPYELPFRLIKAFSYVGETILDPFLGSGTTLLAAVDLKRNGVGYEIHPEIARDAIIRLRNHQPKMY